AILRDGVGAVALDRLRARAEVVLVQAPGHCAVVDRAAAGLIAVAQRRQRPCAGIGVRPPGDRLALDVRAQILALKVPQLVLRAEIRGLEAWAALEPNDLHAGFAELGREDAAGRAHADDDDIGLAGCHGSSPARRRLRLQADDGGAGERPLALQVLR